MIIPYKESRTAVVGSTRQIALDPLLFNGQQVTSLEPGDAISFIVLNADGTELVPATAASYDVIYTDARTGSRSAWSGEFNVGLVAQRLRIVWDIALGAAHELAEDYLDVLASPLADRALQLAADGAVV